MNALVNPPSDSAKAEEVDDSTPASPEQIQALVTHGLKGGSGYIGSIETSRKQKAQPKAAAPKQQPKVKQPNSPAKSVSKPAIKAPAKAVVRTHDVRDYRAVVNSQVRDARYSSILDQDASNLLFEALQTVSFGKVPPTPAMRDLYLGFLVAHLRAAEVRGGFVGPTELWGVGKINLLIQKDGEPSFCPFALTLAERELRAADKLKAHESLPESEHEKFFVQPMTWVKAGNNLQTFCMKVQQFGLEKALADDALLLPERRLLTVCGQWFPGKGEDRVLVHGAPLTFFAENNVYRYDILDVSLLPVMERPYLAGMMDPEQKKKGIGHFKSFDLRKHQIESYRQRKAARGRIVDSTMEDLLE